MENTVDVSVGIYRHFSGKLVYVCGVMYPWSDVQRTSEGQVAYVPLYPVEKPGLLGGITPALFLETVDKPEFKYTGSRYVKVLDWTLTHPNIFPGRKFRMSQVNGEVNECVIARLFESEVLPHARIMCVEYYRENKPEELRVDSLAHILKEYLLKM